MTIEESVFQKAKIDQGKLPSAGFQKAGDSWCYETDFCDGDFHAILTVDNTLHLSGTVIENETGDEYLPLRIKDVTGEFTHHVREEYVNLLESLAIQIGIPVPFQSDQANRIALRITEKYDDAPDFPWSKDTTEYKDYGVFRHPDNEKWYSLILYTAETNLKTEEQRKAEKQAAEKEKQRRAEERRKREEAKKAGKKLPPVKRKKKVKPADAPKVNVLNVKIRPDEKKSLLEENGIFPSFHMNQKNWISIRLDDTLPDDRVMELIDGSYHLTGEGTRSHKRSDGHKVWIVPANPKYYDIISVFSQTDDTIWKQGKGIQTGDTVYMYVALPYSAILYKCTVTQAHSAAENGMELMDIHIDERYPKDLCTLEKMKKYHVTTVRGPRFMPEELEKFIKSGGQE